MRFLAIFTFALLFTQLAFSVTDDGLVANDSIEVLVGRLELEKYKSAIKNLAQFGDRRQGTQRNRKAIDWIEAQLKSYGCSNTERLKYTFTPRAVVPKASSGIPFDPVIKSGEIVPGPGGSRLRGIRARVGVNNEAANQKDASLAELNKGATEPGAREEVYCTKIGSVHPEEMYIVSAHMDGIGFGEAANDDGSGTALVMELARIFNSPDVKTDRSIRFILWNNEETGLEGSKAYVEQRAALQGKENPVGSGKFPEPKWLGMIQHDMMLWDHGMPLKDGSYAPQQRPEADVNIEFQSTSKFANQAMKLAFLARDSNEKYATDYPAAVGHHMTNTDSTSFMDLTPSISLRENERGMQTQAGWSPTWHQATDVFKTFSDDDFRLGLNAAQTTLGLVGHLAGANLKK